MPDEDRHAEAKLANSIVERIKPLLAGQCPEVQGAVLCDLLAIYVAGHPSEMRDEILELHLPHTWLLVEWYDRQRVLDA